MFFFLFILSLKLIGFRLETEATKKYCKKIKNYIIFVTTLNDALAQYLQEKQKHKQT